MSDPRIDASVPLDSSVLRDGAPLGRDASSDAGQRSDAAPRLSEIVETYFTNSCVLGRCHTTLSPQGDLALTGRRVGVHEVLVNARSSALPNRIRVVPYDPDASYLLEKLESDTPEVGTRMPPSAVPETEQIARVRAWILAGAPND